MSFVSQYTTCIHVYLLPQKPSLGNFLALQWLSGSVASDSLGSHGLQPARLLCPWDCSRQEYWSGLPFPSPGDFPDRYWTRVSCIAAAAAKLLQSCPTLCDPIGSSPPGSPVPGILQARTLEWVAISFSNAWKWKVKVKLLSCVQVLETPWTAAYQAPPSMGFSRQEYWSGVPLPSPLLHCRQTLYRLSHWGRWRLRLCVSTIGGASSIPGWGTKIPYGPAIHVVLSNIFYSTLITFLFC